MITAVESIAKSLEKIADVATGADDEDEDVQCSTCDRKIVSAKEAFVRDKDDNLHCIECALTTGLFKKKIG